MVHSVHIWYIPVWYKMGIWHRKINVILKLANDQEVKDDITPPLPDKTVIPYMVIPYTRYIRQIGKWRTSSLANRTMLIVDCLTNIHAQ